MRNYREIQSFFEPKWSPTYHICSVPWKELGGSLSRYYRDQDLPELWNIYNTIKADSESAISIIIILAP